MRKLILIVCSIPVLAAAQLRTDDYSFWETAPEPNPTRLATVLGTEAVLMAGTYYGLGKIWYAGQPRGRFRLHNDAENWLGMDKLGHSMTAYYLGYAGMEALQWAGASDKNALWYGGSLGFVFLTGVEIFDGYSAEYGFSIPDMLANAAGTGLLMGQHFLWQEQRLVLKFSARATPYAQEHPSLLGRTGPERLLKDYNGQTYWLSANVQDLTGWQWWPGWLALAAGYGADGMITATYQHGIYAHRQDLPWQRQYYLSLDIDLRALPAEQAWLKGLFKALNFIKIPMPTLEFNQKTGARFYPLYF